MNSESPRVPPIIAVLGATGNQGGGVVRSLLDASPPDAPLWHVRAISSNPTSLKTQNFLAANQTPDNRLTFVYGDVYDAASLRAAFAGVHGVFAITHEDKPGTVITEEQDLLHEIEAGRNMVMAAKECGVKHFVFSSLPDMLGATGGRFKKIYHMDNKYAVEFIARSELKGFTGIIPGFFYSNLLWEQYCRKQADGTIRFCAPLSGSKVTQWTDASYDVGAFAEKIFALGPGRTAGKTYLALSSRISSESMAEIFTRVTGKPAIHSPISLDEYGERASAAYVGPAFKEDIMQMMEWLGVAPQDKICYGTMDPEKDRSLEELGVRASTFEEWLKRSGWMGPEEVCQ